MRFSDFLQKVTDVAREQEAAKEPDPAPTDPRDIEARLADCERRLRDLTQRIAMKEKEDSEVWQYLSKRLEAIEEKLGMREEA